MRALGHRAELDGIRGIAVGVVVLAHAGTFGFSVGGIVGVELFFVLSGFLISTLLLEADAIDLRSFYARRARRLLPALVVLLLVSGVVAAILGDQASLAGVGAGATYVSNIARTESVDLGWLAHLWSLAVEEHFYLAWPVVVIALGRRPRAVGLAAAVGLVASVGWRLHLLETGASWDRIYNGTDTRITGILLGALLAALVRNGLRVPSAPVGAGLLLWLMLPGSIAWTDPFGIGFLAVDVAAAVLILGVVSRPAAALRWGPLVWLGQVSYAAYLWHVPIFEALGEMAHLSPTETIVGIALTLAISALSVRYIERRWRVSKVRSLEEVSS